MFLELVAIPSARHLNFENFAVLQLGHMNFAFLQLEHMTCEFCNPSARTHDL